MISSIELAQQRADLIAALRVVLEDALRRLTSFEAARLRAGSVSREKLRAALAGLDQARAKMIETLMPALAVRAALAGHADPDAAAEATAARIVTEHLEETSRQIRPILDGSRGSAADAEAALEQVLARWPARAPRTANALAADLER